MAPERLKNILVVPFLGLFFGCELSVALQVRLDQPYIIYHCQPNMSSTQEPAVCVSTPMYKAIDNYKTRVLVI